MQVYVIRNHEGKYLRSKGRAGYGKNWVNELEKAKIWTKIGQARAQVTFWYNLGVENTKQQHTPPACPEILVYNLVIDGVINEKDRCIQAGEKKAEKELRRKINRLHAEKKRLDEEEAQLKNNKNRLENELHRVVGHEKSSSGG